MQKYSKGQLMITVMDLLGVFYGAWFSSGLSLHSTLLSTYFKYPRYVAGRKSLTMLRLKLKLKSIKKRRKKKRKKISTISSTDKNSDLHLNKWNEDICLQISTHSFTSWSDSQWDFSLLYFNTEIIGQELLSYALFKWSF